MTRYDPDARPDPDARGGIAENEHGTTITPIEAVIDRASAEKLHASAELTEQIIEERKKRQEPVRMEGLKPLPAELRRSATPRGVIPGGPGALDMAPSMRRSIPAPYRRPRIAVDHHGKTWAYAAAWSVVKGDIVVDFGKVEQAYQAVIYKALAEIGDGDIRLDPATPPYIMGDQVAVGVDMVLVNVAGAVMRCDQADQIRVFRVHDQEAPAP